MKPWSILDEYFKNERSFNYKPYYESLLEDSEIEQDIKNVQISNLFIDCQSLSQSQVSILKPVSKSSGYITITGQIQWAQPVVNGLDLEEQQIPLLSSSPSIGFASSSLLYRTNPLQALNIETPTPINSNANNIQKIKSEIIQILNELNAGIEDEEALIKEQLTSLFEKNGRNGVRAIWELPGELTTSEDKLPELLIALGRANDYTSISERLEVFEYFGAKESSAIRYGVLIGLSNLATSKILPIIYKMKNKENTPILKQITNSIISKYHDKNNSFYGLFIKSNKW